MVRVSVLNDALKTMYNAEKRGKRQVLLRPSSKVVIKFLQVMMRHGERFDCSCASFPQSSTPGHLGALELQRCKARTQKPANTLRGHIS